MHDPDDGPTPAPGEPGESPWDTERRARSWWSSADEADARAETGDVRAHQRDAAANARDAAAEELDADARERERSAYERLRATTRRLNDLDATEADQHVHLQHAVDAIQAVLDSGAGEPLAHSLRDVLDRLDLQLADVLSAGLQRTAMRTDIAHTDQLLARAADDRTAASADRDAAASDRVAAAGDRSTARVARRRAALHRATDDPRTST